MIKMADADGFYRLTADLKNPHPDGRSKNHNNRPIWKKGTLVFIRMQHDDVRGYVEWPDRTLSYIGTPVKFDTHGTFTQGNVVLTNVESAPLTVGQFFRKSLITAQQAVALLIGQGKLTFDDLRAIDVFINSLSDQEYQAFDAKHDL